VKRQQKLARFASALLVIQTLAFLRGVGLSFGEVAAVWGAFVAVYGFALLECRRPDR
jgi:hypothetical protein